jgi:hypothetical protein
VPATIVPLSGLYFLGYKPPVNSVLRPQNGDVTLFSEMIVIFGPFFLSLFSSVLKVRFQLSLSKQNEMMHKVSISSLPSFLLDLT